jgi:hypothetical protein
VNQQNTGLFSVVDADATTRDSAAVRGATNLIHSCMRHPAGKHVLLVCEDPYLGWYDAAAPDLVQQQLILHGARVTRMMVGLPTNNTDTALEAAIAAADAVIFFARIGDQGRFKLRYANRQSVMCYALNIDMLASGYGTLDHQMMVSFKNAIDQITREAQRITVTCPLGTCFEGGPGDGLQRGKEVMIDRFPMGIPRPVQNDGFSGQVALAHYLTPTGSRIYHPDTLALTASVIAHFEGNHITGFTGPADVVSAVEAHYQRIADEFDLDGWYIDSWHAGIHPLMSYDMAVADDPVRWSSTGFQHPRLLHFHTCGSAPPGEVTWIVVDPTIRIDGVALWENGRLHPERFAATKAILDMAPDLAAACRQQNRQIGLDVGQPR